MVARGETSRISSGLTPNRACGADGKARTSTGLETVDWDVTVEAFGSERTFVGPACRWLICPILDTTLSHLDLTDLDVRAHYRAEEIVTEHLGWRPRRPIAGLAGDRMRCRSLIGHYRVSGI
jgi:hypothetical protein